MILFMTASIAVFFAFYAPANASVLEVSQADRPEK